jgi:hypothetical protein
MAARVSLDQGELQVLRDHLTECRDWARTH